MLFADGEDTAAAAAVKYEIAGPLFAARAEWANSYMAMRNGASVTFCVAASKSDADVWITDVFAAERDREQLESAFKAMLERSGARADVQCPLPREDKTEAVNAEFEAEEFNRKLGATLHAAPANEFPTRR